LQFTFFNLRLGVYYLFDNLFIRKLLFDVDPLVVAAIWFGLRLKTIQEKEEHPYGLKTQLGRLF